MAPKRKRSKSRKALPKPPTSGITRRQTLERLAYLAAAICTITGLKMKDLVPKSTGHTDLQGKVHLTAHAKGELPPTGEVTLRHITADDRLPVQAQERAAIVVASSNNVNATESHLNSCFSCDPVIRLPDYLAPAS